MILCKCKIIIFNYINGETFDYTILGRPLIGPIVAATKRDHKLHNVGCKLNVWAAAFEPQVAEAAELATCVALLPSTLDHNRL